MAASPGNTQYEPLPPALLSVIANYIRRFEPERVVIFGSAVIKGLSAKDIDLLVVSKAFQGVLRQRRAERLDLPKQCRFDLFLFTPREFKDLIRIKWPLIPKIEAKSIDLRWYYD